MKTISKEEFVKRYGTSTLNAIKNISQSEEIKPSTFASNLSSSFTGGLDKIKTGFQTTQKGSQNTQNIAQGGLQQARGALGMASGALETAVSPLTALLTTGLQKTGIDKPIGEITTAISDRVANVPALQKFAMENPDAENVISDLINVVGAIYAPRPVSRMNQKIVDSTKKGLEKVGDMTTLGKKAITDTKDIASTNITDIITPIETPVVSVLNPTTLIPKEKLANIQIQNIRAVAEAKTAKFDRYVKQAEKAVVDNSQKTPLAMAGDKGTEALNVINNKLSKQGLLKQEALAKVGDKEVSNMAQFRNAVRDQLREKVGLNITTTADGIGIESAKGRVSKIAFDPADNKLITDTYSLLSELGNNPTVRQIDDTVDALQDLLYKRKSAVAIPVNGQVEGILKNITGKLNNTVKKVAGEQYKKANSKFAYFIDVRDKLNKALGAEGERGATLMKSLFSPSGEKPRRLFEDIKKLTGIDLVEEATIAKFVMENVGDARQASLLEEVIRGRTMSPSSLVEKAFEKTIGKLQDPIGKARRSINK